MPAGEMPTSADRSLRSLRSRYPVNLMAVGRYTVSKYWTMSASFAGSTARSQCSWTGRVIGAPASGQLPEARRRAYHECEPEHSVKKGTALRQILVADD